MLALHFVIKRDEFYYFNLKCSIVPKREPRQQVRTEGKGKSDEEKDFEREITDCQPLPG
jgi:hypothetical protein